MGRSRATRIRRSPRLRRLKRARQRAEDRAGEPQPLPHYQYIPLPDDGRRWIRLVTIHPGTDELRLSLSRAVDLDNPDVRYEALSYVWGSEDNPVMARMSRQGDCVLPITRNLAEALQHLRDPHHPRVMWIDAVCIDQSGRPEKGHQVAMMADIYRKARSVIAWLGLEADDSAHGLEVLEQIGSQVKVDLLTGQFTPSAHARDTTLADQRKPLELSQRDADAILSVLWREWFERLWVRQEVTFAREVRCCIGKSVISIVDLRNAISCMLAKPPSENSPLYSSLGRKRAVLGVKACVSQHWVFSALHYHIRGTKCKDPRDRVYAVLSLLDTDSSDIVPDYSMPLAEVYKEITLKYIERTQGLGILQCCEPIRPSGPEELCSWVPDWSRDVFNLNMVWSLCCGGDMFCSNAFPQSNGVLSVEGVYCAKIRTTQEIWTGSGLDLAGIEKACSPFLSAGIQDSRYVSGEPFLDALCRTLNLNNFREAYDIPNGYVRGWAETLDEFGRLFWDQEPLGTIAQDHYRAYVLAGSFFVTEEGYIGVASRHIQPGDIVVLLLGCKFPIVLRPEPNDQYLVGGCCYMDGIMAGEPLLGPLPDGVRLMWTGKEGGYYRRYFDEKTGEITCEDPRLQRLEGMGLDLEWCRQYWRQGMGRKVDVKPGYLRQLGRPVRGFDLI